MLRSCHVGCWLLIVHHKTLNSRFMWRNTKKRSETSRWGGRGEESKRQTVRSSSRAINFKSETWVTAGPGNPLIDQLKGQLRIESDLTGRVYGHKSEFRSQFVGFGFLNVQLGFDLLSSFSLKQPTRLTDKNSNSKPSRLDCIKNPPASCFPRICIVA